MIAKKINENIRDILKPKNIVGKYLGYKSSGTGMIEYIIKIINKIEVNSDIWYTSVVIYNNFMIEGDYKFKLKEGSPFTLNFKRFKEFIIDFKEISENDVNEIEEKIFKLTKFKNFLENLT